METCVARRDYLAGPFTYADIAFFMAQFYGERKGAPLTDATPLPIAPHQLQEALGPDTINDLSQRTGMPQQDLLSELSRVMPGVVDQLTPHGRLPDESEQAHW